MAELVEASLTKRWGGDVVSRSLAIVAIGLLTLSLLATGAIAQVDPGQNSVSSSSAKRLFAVEFRIGPAWVADKPPNEQLLFGEHSANLRKLREAGALKLGARYSDKGLVVLEAESETAAREMVEADPSVAAGTFVYEIHELSVFYEGALVRPAKLD